MIKLLLHESKRRVGSPGVFITPGTYFISTILHFLKSKVWYFIEMYLRWNLGPLHFLKKFIEHVYNREKKLYMK